MRAKRSGERREWGRTGIGAKRLGGEQDSGRNDPVPSRIHLDELQVSLRYNELVYLDIRLPLIKTVITCKVVFFVLFIKILFVLPITKK